MEASVNVNRHVWVRLTALGRKVLKASGESPFDKQGAVSQFQFAVLMRVFGPCMVVGGELPFKDNLVTLTPPIGFKQF